VHVLQHDPQAVLVAHVQQIVCHNILALSEGNLVQLLGRVKAKALGKQLHRFDWVSSWRENEEDGRLGRRISKRRSQHLVSAACVVTFDIGSAVRKGPHDEVVESASNAIWSQAACDKHLLEWHLLESLPVEWQLLVLGCQCVVPVLETARRLLFDVVCKLFETFEFDETHN